jgi:hypothetical protein
MRCAGVNQKAQREADVTWARDGMDERSQPRARDASGPPAFSVGDRVVTPPSATGQSPDHRGGERVCLVSFQSGQRVWTCGSPAGRLTVRPARGACIPDPAPQALRKCPHPILQNMEWPHPDRRAVAAPWTRSRADRRGEARADRGVHPRLRALRVRTTRSTSAS